MQYLLPVPWLESVIEICDSVIVKVAVKLPDDDPLVLALEKGPCIAYQEERRWRLAQGKLFDQEPWMGPISDSEILKK